VLAKGESTGDWPPRVDRLPCQRRRVESTVVIMSRRDSLAALMCMVSMVLGLRVYDSPSCEIVKQSA
jgi:hypothetical protein